MQNGSCTMPMVALVLVSAGMVHAQGPTIAPGGTVIFTDAAEGRVIPDTIMGDREFIAPNFATFDDDVVPLSSLVFSTTPFLPTSSEVVQASSFNVSGDSSRPVQAQVSGSVSIRGFLAILGGGQAGFDVIAELVDVTEAPAPAAPDNVVAMQHVRTYQVAGEPDVSIGVGANGQAGSFTVGQLGLDVSAEVSVPLCKEIVRDELDFGFQALVKRGHTYDIRLRCVASARMAGSGGFAVISFFSPLAPVPGELTNASLLTVPPLLMSPEDLVGALDLPFLTQSPFDNIPIPNVGGLTLRVPVYNLPVVGSFGGQTITLRQPFTGLFGNPANATELLASQDIPTTPGDLLTRFFDTAVPEQALDFPGVDLRRLEVAVQADSTEQLAELSAEIANLQAMVMALADDQGNGGAEGEGEDEGESDGNGGAGGVQCAGMNRGAGAGDIAVVAAVLLLCALGFSFGRARRRPNVGPSYSAVR